MPNIQVSDNAFKRIKILTAPNQEDAGKKLRVSVNSGGCSGFKYKYTFEHDTRNDDLILTKNDSSVLIDPISQQFLDGSVIDYKETLGFASFEITNPNAQSKCGCGNSFSV
jgi:iron-sulfur cluster assembly accessory protein